MSVKHHEAFALDSAQDRFWWIDHFLGDQLQDEWRVGGVGTGVVVDQQPGGIVRITTGATTNDACWIDWVSIRSLHVNKKVALECRTKLVQTTACRIDLSLQFDGNNAVMFRYDSTIGANWQIRNRDGGAGANIDSGIAADTSYHIFRIECFPAGEVHYFIDGTETTNSPVTTNIPDDAGDYLEPQFEITTWVDATKSMDIDYVAIRQDR